MKCFVISPIDAQGTAIRTHADEVYSYIVEPALKEFAIEPIRSDQMSTPGKITEHMYRALFGHDLCIAILTFANPNVYYELALAQSACRPTVILIEKGNVLPFDVKDQRCLEYDLSITSYNNKTHIKRLISFLEELKQGDWKVDDMFGPYRAEPIKSDLELQDTLPASFPSLLLGAKDVWISGVHRNEFLLAQNETLERAAAAGVRLHFLFAEPGGAAIRMAAMRFPSVDDSTLDARRATQEEEKLLQSIATVNRLAKAGPPGGVELRLLDFLFPYGNVLINPELPSSRAFTEHYTFRTRGGRQKPKTEHHAGSQWHALLASEFKELWRAARPHRRSDDAAT